MGRPGHGEGLRRSVVGLTNGRPFVVRQAHQERTFLCCLFARAGRFRGGSLRLRVFWIPACAGMTGVGVQRRQRMGRWIGCRQAGVGGAYGALDSGRRWNDEWGIQVCCGQREGRACAGWLCACPMVVRSWFNRLTMNGLSFAVCSPEWDWSLGLRVSWIPAGAGMTSAGGDDGGSGDRVGMVPFLRELLSPLGLSRCTKLSRGLPIRPLSLSQGWQ